MLSVFNLEFGKGQSNDNNNKSDINNNLSQGQRGKREFWRYCSETACGMQISMN